MGPLYPVHTPRARRAGHTLGLESRKTRRFAHTWQTRHPVTTETDTTQGPHSPHVTAHGLARGPPRGPDRALPIHREATGARNVPSRLPPRSSPRVARRRAHRAAGAQAAGCSPRLRVPGSLARAVSGARAVTRGAVTSGGLHPPFCAFRPEFQLPTHASCPRPRGPAHAPRTCPVPPQLVITWGPRGCRAGTRPRSKSAPPPRPTPPRGSATRVPGSTRRPSS